MYQNFTFLFKSRWLLLILLLSVLSAETVYSQETVRVSGTVKAQSDGASLPGVSVNVKGLAVATTTGVDGSFSLNVPSNATLIFSYIGFLGQEIPLNGRTQLTITLSEDVKTLGEVVIVGYGTARKQDLTGSVAVVGAEDFQTGNITTPEQLIAGKVAGVSITSASGQPGAASKIRIRGGSSINASNDPLFVIDGVPLETGGISGASNPLSFINPDDIESFTVLKDASAAAIYGARAANGVIIITTKKGQSGAFKVGFNTVNSMANVIRTIDVLSADELRTIVQSKGLPATMSHMVGTESTNWQDQIYQTGITTDNNLTFSGGVKNFPYRLSLGYQDQAGIVKTDRLQTATAAFSLNPRFFDNHLKVDLNLKGTLQKTRFANTAAIGSAVSFNPTQGIYSNNSEYNGYYEYEVLNSETQEYELANLVLRNPVGLLNQTVNRSKPKRSIGNLQLDYKFHFLPDLHANLNLGYDIADGRGTTFTDRFAASQFTRGGFDNQYRSSRENTNVDFYLNYIKEIKSIKSRVDLTTGYTYNNYLNTDYNFPDINAAGEVFFTPTIPFNKPQNRLNSYFARANYNFDDRYLLTATFRRDGSSRFGEDYRYGNFPSVALAWTLKNENFLKNNTTISNLKLRLGYGVTGQQDGIGNYDYLSYYQISDPNAQYQFGDAFYSMYRPAAYIPDRKWEETATSNLGIDAGFLDERLSFSLDLYSKKTSDLLINIPQPAGTNFSATAVVNVGDMTNKGIELSVNAQPLKKRDLIWDAGFNITYNDNEITKLLQVTKPGAPPIANESSTIGGGVGGQAATRYQVGYPKNTFYLFQQVYDQNGKPLEGIFVDQNNDGLINTNDLKPSKNVDGNIFLGYSNNISYKKWNTGFVLRGTIGNYVYDNVSSGAGTFGNIAGNAVLYNASRAYLTDRFEGSDGNQLLSDYYLHNASFLKMDNFNIGYNAGRIFSKATLKISATVQNVFTITNYKGLDPEIDNGVDNNFYPRPRTFSLGLNLSY